LEREQSLPTAEHPHPSHPTVPQHSGYSLPPGYASGQEYHHYPPPAFHLGGPPGNGFGGPGLSAGEPPNFLDPVSLLLGLRRRWLQTLLIGLICAVAAAGITWKVWPADAWTVTAAVQVNPFGTPILTNPPPKSAAEVASFKQTQEALILSRMVLYNAINQPEVRELPFIKELVARDEDPVTWLNSHMTASYSAPEILNVNLTGDDPEAMQKIVNAVVKAYMEGIVHKDDNGYQSRLARLQMVYNEYNEKAQERKEALANLSQALNIHETEAARSLQQYAQALKFRVQSRLLDLQLDLVSLQTNLNDERARLKALAKQPISDDAIDQWVDQDPEVDKYRQLIAERQAYLDQLETVVRGGKENKFYQQGLAQLDAIKKEMAKRRRKVRPLAEDELRDSLVKEQKVKVDDLENRVRNAEQHEKKLQDMLKEATEKAQHINEDTKDLETFQADLNALNDFLGRISTEMETLKVELKAPPKIQSLGDAWATPPGIGRKQIMATWAAGLGAFALVLVGFSWREFRARKINTLDEIVHGLGLRVVGTLPALPDRKSRAHEPYGVSQGGFWPSQLIESVDTTRTMLLHAARVESIRSVMIASAQSGEGKTSLAIQLAASLARAGRKTLYIDGDLRNPAAHQVFNLSLQPGLSELLRGEVQIPAAIQPTSVRGLWVIPAGLWNAQATEALAQEGARPILNRLKNEFDFVVLDSSPALAVVDGLLLGQQVDAVIFSIMHGLSHSPSVYSAHQRFEALGIRILGAVVNGVAPTQREYQLTYSRDQNGTPPPEDELTMAPDEEPDIE
jgi:capsular exopolysaccharide synthesis family protein